MGTSETLASAILCAPRPLRRKAMAHEFHSGMREESLAAAAFLALPTGSLSLLCLEGELWLTRDGDATDHIIQAGEQFPVRRRDRVTVQALRPSRIRVSEN